MALELRDRDTGVYDAYKAKPYPPHNPEAKARPIPLSPCNCCAAHKKAICASLDGTELHRFRKLSQVRLVKAGQSIYRELDPANYLYTVVSGEARLSSLLNDGRRQVTDFRACGDKLGEHIQGYYSANAEAITDMIVCQIPLPELQARMSEMPGLRVSLMEKMETEINQMRSHLMLLGRKTPIEKVATFLVERAKKFESATAENTDIGLSMSRRDIADYLGLTIETVSRTLTALKTKGVVSIPSPDQISVLDMMELKYLAGIE
ncbi:helix-turn-helix domain-containing protein [Sneathiella marina]|uniref:Helix-turn-helix domain-containing protein n=1 Tax=Sneathiella marina TaxID=2950108 RepID=A0ABY4VZR9_9PROT|nr:helix-turn-helix domain-containing protein [Sneathiella marina]USG60426.1 helix-turn-helix domain-containing protein [Sneathiella marina]